MIYINETRGKDHALKLKTYEFNLWVARIICIVAGALFCVVGIGAIVFCISRQEYEPLGLGVPALIAGPLFILWGIYFKKVSRRLVERGKQNVAPVTRVSFDGNGLEVTVPFNRKKSGWYAYGEVTVTDYPEAWVLELADGKWHTLNKSDMIEGTAEGLSALLAERLGERYRIGEDTI